MQITMKDVIMMVEIAVEKMWKQISVQLVNAKILPWLHVKSKYSCYLVVFIIYSIPFFQLFFIYLGHNGKEIRIAMMKTTLQDVIMMGEIVVEEVRFIALYVNASKWLVDKWFFSPGYMGMSHIKIG